MIQFAPSLTAGFIFQEYGAYSNIILMCLVRFSCSIFSTT